LGRPLNGWMWKHFAITSYTSKCPPPPVSSNTSAATQDPIYSVYSLCHWIHMTDQNLQQHEHLQYCRPCFFYVLQIPFLDCQLSNYHQMVQMLSLLTMYISFTCSCLVLISWPPFYFAFYKDDCTTRGVSHCGLAIYILKVS